jgi:hypothetical protein
MNPSFAYIKRNDSDVRYLEYVCSIKLAHTLSFLDTAKVVLPHNVHNAQHSLDGPFCNAHSLIHKHLSLVQCIILDFKHVRLLPIYDQSALTLVDVVNATDLYKLREMALTKKYFSPWNRVNDIFKDI